MENPKELIGVLQAISIVADSLAVKLMRINKEVKEYENRQSKTSVSKKPDYMERRTTNEEDGIYQQSL